MNYELDNLRREVQNFKYDITRKVDNEDYRRKIRDLEDTIQRLDSNLSNRIDEMQRVIDGLTEKLNELSPP